MANAKKAGWVTSTNEMMASAGAIAVWQGGKYGHVAVVETADMESISFTEMNWGRAAGGDARTSKFNKVTHVTLKRSKLDRGSSGKFKFVGLVIPERIEGTTRAIPPSPEYASGIRQSIEWISQLDPRDTFSRISNALPKGSYHSVPRSDIDFGGKLQIWTPFSARVRFWSPIQTSLSWISPGDRFDFEVVDLRRPPEGWKRYQGQDIWESAVVILDVSSAENKAFGQARIEAIAKVLGSPNRQNFADYFTDSEESGWHAEWRLPNGRTLIYKEHAVPYSDGMVPTVSVEQTHSQLLQVSAKWRDIVSDGVRTSLLKSSSTTMIRVIEKRVLDPVIGVSPKSSVEFAIYDGANLIQYGQLAGDRAGSNPDKFQGWRLLGNGDDTLAFVEASWNQGGSGSIHYYFVIGISGGKLEILERIRAVCNPSGEPKIFAAVLPSGEQGFLVCEPLADGESRASPSHWRLSGYAFRSGHVLEMFKSTTAETFDHWKPARAFSLSSAGKEVPTGWRLSRFAVLNGSGH